MLSLLLGPFLLAAVVTDVRSRRIPNAVTIPMSLGGLALAVATHGVTGFAWAVAGFFVGGTLLLPLFLLRGMGAGDVKLLAAVGAFLGPVTVLYAFLATAILGAGLAVTLLILRKRGLSAVTKQAEGVWLTWITKRNHLFFGTENPDDPVRIPYAIPIALGSLGVAIWTR